MNRPDHSPNDADGSGGRGPGNPRGWRAFLLGLRAPVALALALTAGWFGSRALFRLTGVPPAFAGYLIAAFLGILIAAGIMALIAWVGPGRDGRRPGMDLLEEINYVLERMSRGDFSARVTTSRRGPFADVVASVNKMAGELGTLEQNRQDFITNISHEIGSPLTSIRGFAELLRDRDLDRETASHYLDVIAAECDRLGSLSENLLRLTTLEDAALRFSDVRLDQQLADVVLAMEPQWAAKALDVELDAPPLTIFADGSALHQVWANLIGNAIKFTQPGGRVKVAARPSGEGVAVCVSDTGSGIAPQDMPHVFERFYRGDKARSVGGNGLGLALAKRIVELHGGVIDLTSSLGQGAEFTVSLPARPA